MTRTSIALCSRQMMPWSALLHRTALPRCAGCPVKALVCERQSWNQAVFEAANATCVLLQVWKLPSLVLSVTLRGHKRGVWAAAFSPVEKVVATASGDKTIKLWSLQDGGCLRTLQGHAASVLRLSFLSAGMQVTHPLLGLHSHTCYQAFLLRA